MRSILKSLFVVLLVAGLVSTAGADVVADYNFGVDSDNPSFLSVDANADSVASALSDDALGGSINEIITATNGKIGDQEAGTVGVEFPVYQASKDNFGTSFADDSEEYFAFNVAASNDLPAWDLLTFDWYRSDATSFNARVLASTTDVDGEFVQIGSPTGDGPVETDEWESAPSIDLSSLAALNSGETMYFRLQFSDDGGGFANIRSLGLDNIQVSVVPEPATMALLGLGGL
ncbi:MAG: hypothetical protein ACLFVU_00985, partial [Phycisphaerae bacterium]